MGRPPGRGPDRTARRRAAGGGARGFPAAPGRPRHRTGQAGTAAGPSPGQATCCRVVARSNTDLQRVIDAIVSTEGVVRSATLISLATQVPYRVLPLVRSAAGQGR